MIKYKNRILLFLNMKGFKKIFKENIEGDVLFNGGNKNNLWDLENREFKIEDKWREFLG